MKQLSDRGQVECARRVVEPDDADQQDRKSTRLNSSHDQISYAVFCLKKKNKDHHVFPHILTFQNNYHQRSLSVAVLPHVQLYRLDLRDLSTCLDYTALPQQQRRGAAE